MFFKCKMLDTGNGCLYNYVIIESDVQDEAYDRALGHLPILFGEAEATWPEEVAEPLKEPWPVFAEAYFTRIAEEYPARQKD